MKTCIPMQNNPFLFAIIDEEDFERVNRYGWFAEKRKYGYYAMTSQRFGRKTKHIRLHRFILNARSGQIVDHKNRDGLDCQKANLRFVTKSQNALNRQWPKGKVIGVRPVNKGFEAYITKNRKYIYIGLFHTQLEAISARDAAAIQLHKEFAVING